MKENTKVRMMDQKDVVDADPKDIKDVPKNDDTDKGEVKKTPWLKARIDAARQFRANHPVVDKGLDILATTGKIAFRAAVYTTVSFLVLGALCGAANGDDVIPEVPEDPKGGDTPDIEPIVTHEGDGVEIIEF